MKYTRRAAKRDTAEKPIVAALEAAGWIVVTELPVDLLCIKRVGNRIEVRLLECKTRRNKKGEPILDKRQAAQRKFLELTDTPIVTTPFEALLAVGERVAL